MEILPIAKIPDPLEPAHFRSIRILPTLSKALEILMHEQMVCFLESVDVLDVFPIWFPIWSQYCNGYIEHNG
jgi:hypothetical protein